jgi:hypothetical protein
MTPPPPDRLDPGQAAFCRGVVAVGEQLAPGFGAFIAACVRRALEAHDHAYDDLEPPPRRRSQEESP